MEIEEIGINQPANINKTDVKKVEPKTEPYPNDSVEISNQKDEKKLNNIQKTCMSIASAMIATAGLSILILKYQGNRIKKLYDKKLIIKHLQEKIDFKEAKTIEEGIKFAKEILGIKEVDKDFSLEAINTINKGLVDVSNANKGKIFMPYALKFTLPLDERSYVAAVQMNINNPEFGNMYINRYYFDKTFIDGELYKKLFDGKKPLFEFDNNLDVTITPIWDEYIFAKPSKEVAKLINKYYNNQESLTISEKRSLFYSLSYGKDDAGRSFRNPMETFKNIEISQKNFLTNNNIKIDYQKLSKLSHEEQKKELIKLLEIMKSKDCWLVKEFKLYNPLKTIYHEMGHLQDAAKNLKELDLKQWKFDWKAEWQNIKNRHKFNKNTRVGVDEVDNRWGSISNIYYENMLKKHPAKFKKHYPDLYEFVTDKNIQQTAGKISSYAQTGIGEFIADTYAKMINGQKIPDDVMALYRKYKGPEFFAAA